MGVKHLPVHYAKYTENKMILWKQELQKLQGLKIVVPDLLNLPLTISDNWHYQRPLASISAVSYFQNLLKSLSY